MTRLLALAPLLLLALSIGAALCLWDGRGRLPVSTGSAATSALAAPAMAITLIALS